MAEKTKKTSILKVIKAEEFPVEPEPKATVEKSQKKQVTAEKKKSKKTTTAPKKEQLPEQSEPTPPCDLQPEQPVEHLETSNQQSNDGVKKVLPPIPERTPQEWKAAFTAYNKSQKEFINSLPKRIPPAVGKVADNLAKDRLTFFIGKKFKPMSSALIERLLLDPSLVAPTWDVLTDNDLPVSLKIRQLRVIGWEAEIMPGKRGFINTYILARILERGIR